MINFLKKSLLTGSLFFLALGLFFPSQSPVNAASDQRCFTQEKCFEIRQNLGSPNPNEGFVVQSQCGTAPAGVPGIQAGAPMGYCLPPLKATSQIGIGGKREFVDIGDYIKTMYQYGVGMAGILAVVVIIGAGLSWTMSGGNAATIQSAQKRIFGSIIGLIIAVGSYTLLNLINPALVNLRVPQTWLVNEIPLAASECHLIENTNNFSLAYTKEEQELPANEKEDLKQSRFENANYSIPVTETYCGREYFYDPNSDFTCSGNVCKLQNGAAATCLPFLLQSGVITPDSGACWYGDIILHFKVDSVQQTLSETLGVETSAGLVSSRLEAGSDWLDIMSGDNSRPEDADSVIVYPMCRDANGGITPGFGYSWTQRDTLIQSAVVTANKTIPEIITQLDKIDNPSFWQSACEKKGLLQYEGIMIKVEIQLAAESDDGYMYIGFDEASRTGRPASWEQFKYNWYIPREAYETAGLYLPVDVTQDVISGIDDEEHAGIANDDDSFCTISENC